MFDEEISRFVRGFQKVNELVGLFVLIGFALAIVAVILTARATLV